MLTCYNLQAACQELITNPTDDYLGALQHRMPQNSTHAPAPGLCHSVQCSHLHFFLIPRAGLGEDDRMDPAPADSTKKPTPRNAPKLFSLADVDVHDTGTYKYVLCEVSKGGFAKNVVRASRHFDLHVDNFQALRMETRGIDAKVKMLGGGRLTNDNGNINVYGYSATFGRCETCNRIASEILKEGYSGAKEVTWTNEGY
jgi:hypothetical protein